MGALTYPIFANWAWGGGWLAQLGTNYGLGHGYADFAGPGVVHSVGGMTALMYLGYARLSFWPPKRKVKARPAKPAVT